MLYLSSFRFELVAEEPESAPHPFIIEPPPERRHEYKTGDPITFNLILIGKAMDYLPYFIYTFEELGKIGIVRRIGLLSYFHCSGNPSGWDFKRRSFRLGKCEIREVETNEAF